MNFYTFISVNPLSKKMASILQPPKNRVNFFDKISCRENIISQVENFKSGKNFSSSLESFFSKTLFEKKKVMAEDYKLTSSYLKTFQTKSGIQVIDISTGKNETPPWGSILKIDYAIYIFDGKEIRKIDSTFDKKEIFTYQHGTGEINIYLEEIIHSMKLGGKRRAIVKINPKINFLSIGPVLSQNSAREQLKLFIQKNSGDKDLFFIYDIELKDILNQKID